MAYESEIQVAARTLGSLAQKEGRSLATNPFKTGSQEYLGWEIGYRGAAHPSMRSLASVKEDDVIPAGINIGDCVVITPNAYSRWKHPCFFGWVVAITKYADYWAYKVGVGPDEEQTFKAEYVQRYEDGEHWATGDE